MSEHPQLRIDQLTGLRTILAPGRSARPDAFKPTPAESRPDAVETCPFCEGREDRTPPEIWADRPAGVADSPGWLTRVVPNMYPALATGDDAVDAQSAGAASAGPGGASVRPGKPPSPAIGFDPLAGSTRDEADLFREMPAAGAHEVIVNTPEHHTSLAQLAEPQLRTAVGAWCERIGAHSNDASYVHLIVNEGPLAGASLEHSHAQLYALNFVPATIARERERASAYHERTMGGHLLGDILAEEVRRRDRLVAFDDSAVLFCPWASHSPFELRIVPRQPAPRFEEGGVAAVGMLATGLRALGTALGELPQLNLWIRTAPRSVAEFSWHIDIRPRLTTQAGLEIGAGVDLNTYAPEVAAADLRAALAG